MTYPPITGYYFEVFGYASAITTVIMEGPHAFNEMRRLLRITGCHKNKGYIIYYLFVLLLSLFSRIIVFSYVTYGFLFEVTTTHILLKIAFVCQYMLNLDQMKILSLTTITGL